MRQRQRHLTERVMRSQINMKDSILILAGGMRLTFIMCHSLSCYNQLPQTGWLNDLFLYIEQNKINKTLQFWRLGSSRARCWQVQCLLRVCSLVCKLPSSCNPHWWRAERGRASSPVCYEGTNAIREGLTPMTKYLSRPHLLAQSPWQLRLRHMNSRGHKQFVAVRLLLAGSLALMESLPSSPVRSRRRAQGPIGGRRGGGGG